MIYILGRPKVSRLYNMKLRFLTLDLPDEPTAADQKFRPGL